jgi:hypothetical protein
MERKPYWSPYVAGFGLGLVLLASFLVLGTGLGASGGFGRVGILAANTVAPDHVQTLEHAAPLVNAPGGLLKDGILFGVIGVAIGGFLSAWAAGRVMRKPILERGPNTSKGRRILFAILGGIVMGFAARLGRGCTSGQALSGGAMLAAGSWAFMMCVFAGGFGFAWFARKQWR